MGKNDMKEPVPRDLPIEHPYVQPTPFPRCLKGNLYKICKAVCMIGIPKKTHKVKTQMDNGCDITFKDVERLRKMLTPTIHTLPNLEPVVQLYMPLSPFRDKAIVSREEEQDNDIPLKDGDLNSNETEFEIISTRNRVPALVKERAITCVFSMDLDKHVWFCRLLWIGGESKDEEDSWTSLSQAGENDAGEDILSLT
ncbi:hypothetical protein Tco_1065444 [Tanacetum coccineum]